jgi:predicted Zn finger-like uncharacterized protein
MPVRVACQHCDAKYQVREDKLGKKVRCQKCGETFVTAVAAASGASENRKPQASKPTSLSPSSAEVRAAWASPPIRARAETPAGFDDNDDDPFDIDTTPKPKPAASRETEEETVGKPFWKVVGVIAGVFVLTSLIGLFSPKSGLLIMGGWLLAGFGLIGFGFVRMIMALTGKQRFWMTCKIVLHCVGWKLFYIDADMYNRKTLRAFAWIGTGLVVILAAFLPGIYFANQLRAAVQNGNDPNDNQQQVADREPHQFPEDPAFGAKPAPDPFAAPPGGGFGGDPGRRPPPGGFGNPGRQPAPGGFGPPGMGAPPGFGPTASPPVYDPEHPPAMLPNGGIPIHLSYVSLDGPFTEIPARAEQELVKFEFYHPRSVLINPNTKMVLFAAKTPPGRDDLPRIYEAFARAGVKIRPIGNKP